MKQHIKLLSTISVIALLTACGGGGGTSVDETPKENTGGIDGGTSGGTDGGTSGGTDGGTSGGTDGGTSGGTDGGTSGGTDGGTSGGTDGGTSGGTDGGTSGGTDGGTSGGTDGGTSGGTDGGTQQEARYETLSSEANKTSTLGGSSLVLARDAGIFATKSVTGTLTHDTGAIKADDGIYLFQSASQSNNGVYYYDGNGAELEFNIQNGTYEYMGQFYQEYTVDGKAYSNSIVGGIITSIEDIPTSDLVTYSGEAHIFGRTDMTDENTEFQMEDGSSTVLVDFGAAQPSVDVDMTKFTQNTGTSPFTTVKITGMTLNGNTYSGGTIKTYNSGTEVNMTGQNVTGGAQGAFFGYDETNSRPDETGGVVLQIGETGGFGGVFLAD
ncbi:hypothetical protein N9A67_06100 [Rhodobacteraceae bacterium]|nr:hypothetical protein [Paracoccaceae bacterium]